MKSFYFVVLGSCFSLILNESVWIFLTLFLLSLVFFMKGTDFSEACITFLFRLGFYLKSLHTFCKNKSTGEGDGQTETFPFRLNSIMNLSHTRTEMKAPTFPVSIPTDWSLSGDFRESFCSSRASSDKTSGWRNVFIPRRSGQRRAEMSFGNQPSSIFDKLFTQMVPLIFRRGMAPLRRANGQNGGPLLKREPFKNQRKEKEMPPPLVSREFQPNLSKRMKYLSTWNDFNRTTNIK